jgi:hypothetical protein
VPNENGCPPDDFGSFVADNPEGDILAGAWNDASLAATVVVAATGLQHLLRIRRLYPDAIEETEARQLFATLVSELERALRHDNLVPLLRVYERPEFDCPVEPVKLSAVTVVLLMRMPGRRFEGKSVDEVRQEIGEAFVGALALASPPVRASNERIHQLRMLDCRVPNPIDDPAYRSPRRLLQVLREYWFVMEDIVLFQMDAPIGWTPHPLLSAILNMKDRMAQCFAGLGDMPGAQEAHKKIEHLVDIALSGEPDELSVVPEWTRGEVGSVDRFLMETQLILGSMDFALTPEENLFIDAVKTGTAEWKERTQRTFAEQMKRLEKLRPSFERSLDRASGSTRPDRSTVPPPLLIPQSDKVAEICSRGEDQLHEFKRAGVDIRKITREVAGMLNTRQGGMILYGVEDDGAVGGADMSRQKFDQALQNSVRNAIAPAAAVTVGEVDIAGKLVLVVVAPPWDQEHVYHYEGRVYIRRGTNVFEAKVEEIARLHRGECV